MSDLSLDEQILSSETDRAISDLQDDAIRESDALELAQERIKWLESALDEVARVSEDRREALEESLDEAKYDEPELRSKLDKQRQRIERLEAVFEAALKVERRFMLTEGGYGAIDVLQTSELSIAISRAQSTGVQDL